MKDKKYLFLKCAGPETVIFLALAMDFGFAILALVFVVVVFSLIVGLIVNLVRRRKAGRKMKVSSIVSLGIISYLIIYSFLRIQESWDNNLFYPFHYVSLFLICAIVALALKRMNLVNRGFKIFMVLFLIGIIAFLGLAFLKIQEDLKIKGAIEKREKERMEKIMLVDAELEKMGCRPETCSVSDDTDRSGCFLSGTSCNSEAKGLLKKFGLDVFTYGHFVDCSSLNSLFSCPNMALSAFGCGEAMFRLY